MTPTKSTRHRVVMQSDEVHDRNPTRATAKVQRAARKAALARQELDAAMREARAAGLPLRTIAKAAGLSPEWVRQRTS